MMLEVPATWTEKLLAVTSAFSRSRTAREVGEVAVSLGVEALGASSGALALVRSGGKRLRVVSSSSLEPEERDRRVRSLLPPDRGLAAEAFRQSAPVFAESPEEQARWYPRAVPAAGEGGGTRVAAPLMAGDRPIGFLVFGFSSWVTLSPGARSFVQALASIGTQALERARLLDAEQKARRRLKILTGAAEAFNAPAMSVRSVLDAVTRQVGVATGDDCILRLVSPDGAWLEPKAWWAAQAGAREALAIALSGERQPVGEGLAAHVIGGCRTLFLTGVDDPERLRRLSRGHRAWIESRPVRALIAVPLQLKGRIIGVLEVARARPLDAYTDEDRLLVEGLAARAASAIEKARLYEEVVRSQRLFEGIADASPDILYLFDLRRGRTVYVSRGAERVLGRSLREIAAVGDAFYDKLVHPDDAPMLKEQNARFATLADGELVEHEYRMRHADGSWRWVRSRDRVFSRTPDGEPELVLGVASDVTRQVLAEKEREELLAREQQARREAETASRAKDEFLAMLGHELRNPLSPMITALELMRLRGGDVLERERTIVERQVQHLMRLVDDLLDVSRITRGKIQLKRRPVELGEVIGTAIEMASPLLEGRRHRLEADVPRRGLLVEGDPDRLAQVVANLLTNAAKYTEPGGEVRVRAAREGSQVVVRVHDSGMGIAPELLPRVFDLFVQGYRALDRSQGGLGLGLTIVRSLVDMHGGAVAVASEGVGKGCEFTVRLPAASAAALTPAPGAIPAVASRRRASGGRRVLVVDDNQDAADALVDALRARGLVTTVAYDGPGALEVAARSRPEAAILDIGLPVMDGYELARRLRELLGPAVKLVALTGYGQDRDRDLSRAAGFDEHLVKPVELELIVVLIHRLFERAEAPGAAAT